MLHEDELSEHCTHLIDLITFGNGIPVPQAVLDQLIQIVRERDRMLMARGWRECARSMQARNLSWQSLLTENPYIEGVSDGGHATLLP